MPANVPTSAEDLEEEAIQSLGSFPDFDGSDFEPKPPTSPPVTQDLPSKRTSGNAAPTGQKARYSNSIVRTQQFTSTPGKSKSMKGVAQLPHHLNRRQLRVTDLPLSTTSSENSMELETPDSPYIGVTGGMHLLSASPPAQDSQSTLPVEDFPSSPPAWNSRVPLPVEGGFQSSPPTEDIQSSLPSRPTVNLMAKQINKPRVNKRKKKVSSDDDEFVPDEYADKEFSPVKRTRKAKGWRAAPSGSYNPVEPIDLTGSDHVDHTSASLKRSTNSTALTTDLSGQSSAPSANTTKRIPV